MFLEQGTRLLSTATAVEKKMADWHFAIQFAVRLGVDWHFEMMSAVEPDLDCNLAISSVVESDIRFLVVVAKDSKGIHVDR